MGYQFNLIRQEDENFQSTEPRRRGACRYSVLDKRSWSVKVQGKQLPLEWLHDFNSGGAQIRWGQYNSFEEGQQLEVEFYFMGSFLFSSQAEVCWKQSSRRAINMYDFGLNFEESKKPEFKKIWHTRKLNQYLRVRQEAAVANESETKKPFLPLPGWHAVVAFVIPFAIGYLQAL